MAIRKLLIFWKWMQLKQQKLLYQHQAVENTQDSVYCIWEDCLDQDSDNWFRFFCNSELSPQDQIIILFHDANEQRRLNFSKLMRLTKEFTNISTIYFGGGENFIYYHQVTNSGLIDQVGGFQDGLVMNGGYRTVLIDGKIKEVVFNEVWDFYNLNKYKVPIYTILYEKLLADFFVNEKNILSIGNWLRRQNKSTLTDCVTEFLASDHPIFQHNKASLPLFESRSHLLSLLDKPSPTAHETRQAIQALLKNIPGPIY